MELVRFPSRGGFSVRSILTFAFAVLITALFWATSGSLSAHADTDAHWGGDAIIYNDHGFTEATDVKDTTGTIPDGSKIYKTPVLTTGSGASASQKVFIIYFTPGVDPPTSTSAKYVEFDDNNGTLSNPQNQKDISLTDKSHQTSGSSCQVGGIGWILCPMTTYLANGMDYIFNILAGMIKTQPPVLGDSSNSMYIAWNIMRTIANVAFVIVFLIIIYSQLTSVGVSNYGLKKLIPRLIVAAVLVNISFYIAALAIDISNILGYSIQSLFNGIREGAFHVTADQLGSGMSGAWAQVTTIILAGGGVYAGAYYMAVGGGVYMLVPLLIGLLTTIILVVVILAARQAIILILVIIAPLAFVANLLPNTEKWFDKWKDLFMTMLIFFPAFSLVFGGSQLAGQLIIQSASTSGMSIVTVLFGLAVQVAPLVITPLILKLSGGLLGRIAQIANNPRKGAIDRSRSWANDRRTEAQKRSIAVQPNRKRFNPWRPAGAIVRRAEHGNRALKDRTAMWEQEIDNNYKQTSKYGKIHERQAKADIDKGRIHDGHERHIEYLKTRPGSDIYDAAMRAQVVKEGLETQQQHTAGYYNTLRTVEGTPLNTSSLNLETAKTNAQASEQNAAAYLNERRTFRTTQLGMAAERLEAAKLNAEGWQNRYTAHIDSLKVENAAGVIPNASISNAAIFAQSGKEHAEAAQARVQAMFDRDRVTEGTAINISSKGLEGAKMAAETAQSITARYMNEQKATVGTTLHLDKIRAEEAKLATQVSETSLNRVVEEYKSGKLVRTGELNDLMINMVGDVENLAAEAQGAAAAGNIQKKNIAETFTAGDQRAADLLATAASVDEYGAVRAQASATATLNDINAKARTANETLLEERALQDKKTPPAYAMSLIKARLGGDMSESKEVIQAAMEIVGKEGQVPLIRKMRMSGNFDQDDLTAMLVRNSGTMKAKGGFDLQFSPDLQGSDASKMLTSMAGTIGSTSADTFSDLKMAAAWDFANNAYDMYETSLANSQVAIVDEDTRKIHESGENGIAGLKKAYANLTVALNDPEVVRKLGDNLMPAMKLHTRLHQKIHTGEVNPVDYAHVIPGVTTDIPSDFLDMSKEKTETLEGLYIARTRDANGNVVPL